MNDLQKPKRIHRIDSLRGFALLGLPFANIIGLWAGHLQLAGDDIDIMLQRIIYVFIEGRFFAIFSFLFGTGVWIFYEGLQAKDLAVMPTYYRRMTLLFGIGIIHQLFQPGEALMIYGLYGFFLPIFFRQPKAFNFLAAILGIVLGSVFQAKVFLPIPYMILGIAFGQAKVFTRLPQMRKNWYLTALLSGIAATGVSIYLWLLAPTIGQTAYITGGELSQTQMLANEQFYAFAKTALLFAPVMTIFYVCLISLFAEKIPFLAKGLQAYGRTAFTNYVMQTVLLLVTLPVLMQDGLVSYRIAFIVCLVIISLQVIASTIWLRYFRYGILEWLWRCGTYKAWLPIR